MGAADTFIRVHAAMVQGGEAASTVVNPSEKAGAFTQSTVSGGDADDEFSGAFAGGDATGGKGKDVFSGFFLGRAEIDGGAGGDAFLGAFNSVKLYGEAGKNFFGFRSGVTPMRIDGLPYRGSFPERIEFRRRRGGRRPNGCGKWTADSL